MQKLLTLDIVTQESRLLTVQARQITVETVTGEITILPDHIPLMTRLKEGLLRYLDEKGNEQVIAIFGGFLELNDRGVCSVLADSAVRAEDVDLARAKQAEQDAKEKLMDKQGEQDFAMIEAALRQATLELKAAQHHNRHRSQ